MKSNDYLMPRKHFTHAFISAVKVEKQTDYYDKKTSGLGLRVSPGGTKTFFYRYNYKGKARRYSFERFRDEFGLSDARTKVDELRSYVKKGGDPHGEEQARKNEEAPKTFKEIIEAYKKRHFLKLKPSTKTDYERRINQFINEFGKRKVNRGIDKIKRIEIKNYLEDKAISSPTNAQRIQAILSGIFSFAKDREWVDSNIAAKINFSKQIDKQKKSQWQNTDFNDAQIRKLWEGFDQHPEPVGSLFKLLMITGQRAGETRLMKWKDLDFKKQLWKIPQADTKNSETHFVFLPDIAMGILQNLKKWNYAKYVFESSVKKGQPVGHPQKAAQRLRKKTKVDDFNIHSLRTTFATRQAEMGTPAQVLSKLLNHKKPGEGSAITALYDRYDYEEEKRTAMNRWAAKLQMILSGEEMKSKIVGKIA